MRPLLRSAFGALSLALVLAQPATGIARTGRAAAEPIPVNTGLPNSDYWPAYAARELKLFGKAGFKPSFYAFQSGAPLIGRDEETRGRPMIKMAITLFRNAMTLEEQQRWWIDDHALIARQMPGLRGYVINLASAGEDGEDPMICGTDELLFDNWDDAQRAYRSPEWQRARAHTAESGAKAVRAWIRETVTVI